MIHTLNKKINLTTLGVKCVYLLFFFALLAGFFHPLITGTSPDSVIIGTLVLSLGTIGGILVYKANSSKRYGLYLGVGLGLLAVSLFFILQLTERL